MNYTLQDVLDLKPCHSEEKLKEYLEGRTEFDLDFVLDSSASHLDKIWLVVRLISVMKAVEFAQWCAAIYAPAAIHAVAAATYITHAATPYTATYVAAAATHAAAAIHPAKRPAQIDKLRELITEGEGL